MGMHGDAWEYLFHWKKQSDASPCIPTHTNPIYENFTFENAWENRNFAESYCKILDPGTQAGSIFKECIEIYSRELELTESDMDSISIFCENIVWPISQSKACRVATSTILKEVVATMGHPQSLQKRV